MYSLYKYLNVGQGRFVCFPFLVSVVWKKRLKSYMFFHCTTQPITIIFKLCLYAICGIQ